MAIGIWYNKRGEDIRGAREHGDRIRRSRGKEEERGEDRKTEDEETDSQRGSGKILISKGDFNFTFRKEVTRVREDAKKINDTRSEKKAEREREYKRQKEQDKERLIVGSKERKETERDQEHDQREVEPREILRTGGPGCGEIHRLAGGQSHDLGTMVQLTIGDMSSEELERCLAVQSSTGLA